MSLQKTVFISVAFAAAFGLSVTSSAIALPQLAQGTLVSQADSGTETRTPARITRLIQNEELIQVELLTTGETVLVPTTTTRHTLDLVPGDYIVITTSDPTVTRDNVTDVEEVTETEANDLLAATQGDSNTSSQTSETSTTGNTGTSTTGSTSSSTRTTTTTTTVQTQQPTTRPAPAPAPAARPAPAPTQPVRALW